MKFCRKRLGGPKRPRSVELLPELPRNALGKVVRRQLRDPYRVGRERMV
jgi:fatty-acyl-CoA synthase